ncbi:MAG: ABC transporter substrate-binding protein [Opitutales bacterium]
MLSPYLKAFLAILALLASSLNAEVLRVGFFPNLTHSPAIAARQLEREGSSWRDPHLDPVNVEWRGFNAGPSAIEALLNGSVDVVYVGASPLLNGYVRTRGKSLRLLAPVATGGNALVARKGLDVSGPGDFRDRRVATPQLGNSQDVSARAWLRSAGLKITLSGGDAQVIPAANPELMMLFARGQVDAAWTVEPWVSRLISDFGGVVVTEDAASVVTVLACSTAALDRRGEDVRAFVRSHFHLRDRLIADSRLHRRLLSAGLAAETRSKPMPDALLDSALRRFRLDGAEPASARLARLEASLGKSMADAVSAGLLRESIPLGPLLEGLQRETLAR